MKSSMIVAAAAVTLLALSVSGCANLQTQVAQFQPVAGDALTGVNNAVNDVLIDQKIELLVVPTCSYVPETYTCTGTTLSGDKIEATAVGAAPETVSIVVGGKQIFSGSIDEVLKKAAQR